MRISPSGVHEKATRSEPAILLTNGASLDLTMAVIAAKLRFDTLRREPDA